MATKVVRICDVCGKADDSVTTIAFGFDNTNYELDLCGKDAKAARESFSKWTDNARRIGSSRAAAVRAKSGNKPVVRKDAGVSPRAVREWAAAHGVEVNDRGRIPEAVILQFREAHPNG